ncbi:MAG: HIT domain-containing protein [Bacillaceae bacterium]
MEEVEDFYCNAVLNGKVPVEKVMETEHVLAFHHTNPFYEQHVVAIPKKHIASFVTVAEDERDIMVELLDVIQVIAKEFEATFGACTISTNIGDYQSNKHMHWHIHFGKRIRE